MKSWFKYILLLAVCANAQFIGPYSGYPRITTIADSALFLEQASPLSPVKMKAITGARMKQLLAGAGGGFSDSLAIVDSLGFVPQYPIIPGYGITKTPGPLKDTLKADTGAGKLSTQAYTKARAHDSACASIHRITAGSNVTVDSTGPCTIEISSSGGGGGGGLDTAQAKGLISAYVQSGDSTSDFKTSTIDTMLLGGEYIRATAGESLSVYNLSYLESDGKFWKADADDTTKTCGWLAVAMGGISADGIGTFLIRGTMDGSSSLVPGASLWVSASAGGITEVKPETSGQVQRRVGYVSLDDKIFFDPGTSVCVEVD